MAIWRLDGDADDGSGPGRLFIEVTDTPGALTANPCGDPDFVQGGHCAVRALPDGGHLVLRGLVDADGIQTVVVTRIHADRSGVTAEAGNFSILGQRAPAVGQALGPARPAPLYTVTDLAELVLAIDQRLHAARLKRRSRPCPWTPTAAPGLREAVNSRVATCRISHLAALHGSTSHRRFSRMRTV